MWPLVAAARLDDLVNLIPARLTGFIYALLAKQRCRAVQIMVADAPRHRSPNAGWPESAVAALLTYACPARAIMRTLLQRTLG